MPDKSQTSEIVTKVRGLFDTARARGINLKWVGQRFDDDWLYLVVEPAQPEGRASDHARFMTEVERKLRSQGYDQVLRVPSVPEYAGLMDLSGDEDDAPAG